jgi:hypothetical protein
VPKLTFIHFPEEWQGGQSPIHWPTPEDKDEAEVMIEPSHLPSRVVSFLGPDYLDTEDTLCYYDYIQAGQRRALLSENILQFSRVNGQDVPKVLQTEIHPRSELQYDGASQLFVMHILHNEAGDAIALWEIVAPLPAISGGYRTLLDHDDEGDISEHMGDNTKLQNLVCYTMDYKQGRPVQVCTSFSILLY